MAQPASQPQIDTCNACGKLFPRIAMRLCAQCSFVEEHRFQLVREFLREHDGSAVGEIARGTGVSGSDVRKFLDGGRLVEITSGLKACTCGGVGIRCKYCRSRLSSTFREMENTMSRELAERDGADRPTSRHGRAVGDTDANGRTSYVRRIRRIGETE